MNKTLGDSFHFERAGLRLKNRAVLAPLTHNMSGAGGDPGQAELDWMARCARGGFGLLIAAATGAALMALANLAGVSTNGVLDKRREAQVAEGYRKQLAIRTPGVQQKVVNLSGGNQQKVVLSKWLFTDPQVLILDEPTRGIDVGAKFEIYGIMNELAAQGRGVVMISSEMPELLGMCDRIYVMNEGRIMGELTRAEASQERIMALILKNEKAKVA